MIEAQGGPGSLSNDNLTVDDNIVQNNGAGGVFQNGSGTITYTEFLRNSASANTGGCWPGVSPTPGSSNSCP